jgi:ketosteroid isomerase-like protein
VTELSTSNGGERKQKRTETVRRLYNEGWAAGNFDFMSEILDPDIVWTAIEDAPDAGTYRGYDGVRAYWQDWLDDFDMHPFKIKESVESGDRIACAQRGETTGKGSGARSVINYACVYTFGADERILAVNEYATWDEALEELQTER